MAKKCGILEDNSKVTVKIQRKDEPLKAYVYEGSLGILHDEDSLHVLFDDMAIVFNMQYVKDVVLEKETLQYIFSNPKTNKKEDTPHRLTYGVTTEDRAIMEYQIDNPSDNKTELRNGT